eukprot:UN01230
MSLPVINVRFFFKMCQKSSTLITGTEVGIFSLKLKVSSTGEIPGFFRSNSKSPAQ